MPIRRLKHPDVLYDEVRGSDLVVVPDPALADALNRRIDEPRLGAFADTPRRLATRRRETGEDRLAFLRVIEETELSWKHAAFAVNEVIHCWDHEARPEAILDYPGYGDPAFEEVVEIAKDLPLTSKLLAEHDLDAEAHDDVAVVGERQLTPLERSVLPAEYESVDPFSDASLETPEFDVLDSSADVVDSVAGSIPPEGAGDVAVVLDGGGRYATLVESALDSTGIPYHGGPGFADLDVNRGFVRTLRAAAAPEVKVGELRPLLRMTGDDVAVDHDEKRISEVRLPELEWIHDLRGRLGEVSFEDALDEYAGRASGDAAGMRRELKRLGVEDEAVTPGGVEALAFYLSSFDVPVERDDEGVLLADALSSAYVDRPLVFFLGVDEAWSHRAPERPWVDEEMEYRRNLRSFQTLLQSGVEREYLVQEYRGAREVTPCLYLEELLDEEYDTFGDLPGEHVAPRARTQVRGFEASPPRVEPEEVERLSQSALNSFVNSPRDWMFGELVDGPDRDYFVLGGLYHDFAEFACNHPGFVDDARVDEAVEVLVDRTRDFYTPGELSLKRTEYRLALENVLRFLRENPPELDGAGEDTGWASNFFEDHWDRPVDSPVTEQWFEDDDLAVKGMVDLELSPSHLVDFKSGRRRSPRSVRTMGDVADVDGEVDFQAPLYLLQLRKRNPGEELEFTFFHFTENADDLVAGDAVLDDCTATVRYVPRTYHDYLATEEALAGLREDAANACNEVFGEVDLADYRDVVLSHDVPRTFDWEDLADTEFAGALAELMRGATGEADVEREWKQALRHLARYRSDTFFEDDLDDFEEFVRDQLDELNRYVRGEERFPVAGPGDEPYWRYVDNRDLILEDRGGNPG